jgi:mannose-6-phosphate isomerase-like protein (cupin superfamily)
MCGFQRCSRDGCEFKGDRAVADDRAQNSETVVTQAETASFRPLTIVDMKQTADSVDQTYRNFVLLDVNQHAIRMAVMEGEYPWHYHPYSDECFLVLEGELEIDVADSRTFHVMPGQAFTVPAGVTHRTRARKRTVNLCFEDRGAYTDVVFVDETTRL